MAKYKAYPEYKDSGVEWLGMVPSHWNIKRLGQFFEERRDKVSDKDYPPLSVTMQGIVPQIDTAAKTDAGDNRKLVLKNDFVINSRSDRKGSSGVSQLNGSVSLISIVMEPKRINPKFAHHLLRSYPFQEEFYRYGKGIVADLWSTNSSEMKNILIPELVDDESNAIACFLDHETAKIDNLIEKQQQLIELLKEKRQAVISHAVTKGLNPDVPMKDSGVEWLGKVPAHWIKQKLVNVSEGSRGSFVNGPFGSDLLAEELRDYGVPVVYIRDIKPTGYSRKSTVFVTPMKAKQLDVCKLEPGNVVVSKVGDPPGDACVYPVGEPSAIITQDVIRIRVNMAQFSPEFIAYLLNSDFGRMVVNDISVEGTRKRVSLGDFKSTRFVFPPLKESLDIVRYLNSECEKLNCTIAKATQAVAFMQERRTALISAAVTGKIDVRVWVAPETQDVEEPQEATA